MRKTLALTVAAVAIAAPLAGTSNAQALPAAAGCVTEAANDRHPAPRMVWVDPYGRIVIDPDGADYTLASINDTTSTFIRCMV